MRDVLSPSTSLPVMTEPSTNSLGSRSAKVIKPRASRARGLRTFTGCLTCRKRRVKCDEGRPLCGNCIKGNRGCIFVEATQITKVTAKVSENQSQDRQPETDDFRLTRGINQLARTEPDVSQATSDDSISAPLEKPNGVAEFQRAEPFTASNQSCDTTFSASEPFMDSGTFFGDRSMTGLDLSPLAQSSAASPGTAPFHWYDLLAQDALSNFERHPLLNADPEWRFDPKSLSRRPSQTLYMHEDHGKAQLQSELPRQTTSSEEDDRGSHQPWNLAAAMSLGDAEFLYLQHYIDTVAPVLDLFDTSKQFGNVVPHLAFHNVGLMKSMLAVAARHMSLLAQDATCADSPTVFASLSSSEQSKDGRYIAAQYYYETLGYLSRAIDYPSYTRSSEILATAIMISTYEMLDGSNREWEKHLKGTFWIQRYQDNNGESPGLRKAVWWAWVRQDIWAAFRERRRTLTKWIPTKPLAHLSTDELAIRVVYLLAKAVNYVSDHATQTQDFAQRLEEGNALLKALQDWYDVLPQAFLPLPLPNDNQSAFKPLWIHPPSYAAAIQTYCFAKILLLLSKPSEGGLASYKEQQRMLGDAVATICGLAQSPHAIQLPSSYVSFQCLFAAGQCVQTPEQKRTLETLLANTLRTCKFAPKALVEDLKSL